jgi:hypothetical protein
MATAISSVNEIENLKKNEETTNRDYKKLKIHKENATVTYIMIILLLFMVFGNLILTGFSLKEYSHGIEALIVYLIIICGIATPIYVWRLREITKIEKMYKQKLLEYSIIMA